MSYPVRMPDKLRSGYKNLSPAHDAKAFARLAVEFASEKVVNGWPFSALIVTAHLLDGRTLLAIVALYHGLEKVRLAPLGHRPGLSVAQSHPKESADAVLLGLTHKVFDPLQIGLVVVVIPHRAA